MRVKEIATPKQTTAADREIVVRIRRRKETEPWRLRRVLSWSVLGVFGDPAMLLVPALGLGVVTIVVFALGAPGRPEVLVPAFAAPPADAFTDAGVIGLVDRSAAATWVARTVMVVLRALVFGLVAALAVARARGETPTLGAAARTIGRRIPALTGLSALAMGFALTVAAGGRIEPGREAGVAGTALVAGMLFFPAAVVAAVADGCGLLGSIRRSARWVVRRPLGHLGLVAGYAIAFGGTIRLALFGEVARPHALPVTLYAFVAAFVTTLFAAGLARRHALLYSDTVLAPEQAARVALRKQRRLERMARRGARRAPRKAGSENNMSAKDKTKVAAAGMKAQTPATPRKGSIASDDGRSKPPAESRAGRAKPARKAPTTKAPNR